MKTLERPGHCQGNYAVTVKKNMPYRSKAVPSLPPKNRLIFRRKPSILHAKGLTWFLDMS